VHMPSHFNPVLGRVLRGCAHAVRPQNAAEAAKSQTRLPSFERPAPTDAPTNTQARRAALACAGVGAHHTARAACAQARTVVPARRGSSRRASCALRATQAPRTSCAPNTRALRPALHRSVCIRHPLQVGHHVRLYRAFRGRHFLLPSQHGLCYIRFHGRAFLPSCVTHMMAGACACTHDRPCTLVGTHASQCEPVPTPPRTCGASSDVNLRSTKVVPECRFRNLD
jgi:hypothetical protein